MLQTFDQNLSNSEIQNRTKLEIQNRTKNEIQNRAKSEIQHCSTASFERGLLQTSLLLGLNGQNPVSVWLGGYVALPNGRLVAHT
jgi:hypothetical protein